MLWIVSSVLALFSGFILVLIFCHILIVPFMETEDFVTTTCLVSNIQYVKEQGAETCAAESRDTNQSDRVQSCAIELSDISYKDISGSLLEHDTAGNRASCIIVTVLYRGVDGFPHQSLLNLKPSGMYEDNNTYLKYKQVRQIVIQIVEWPLR